MIKLYVQVPRACRSVNSSLRPARCFSAKKKKNPLLSARPRLVVNLYLCARARRSQQIRTNVAEDPSRYLPIDAVIYDSPPPPGSSYGTDKFTDKFVVVVPPSPTRSRAGRDTAAPQRSLPTVPHRRRIRFKNTKTVFFVRGRFD